MKKFSLNCVLIGEGNLLTECAEILIRNNYQVSAVISTDQAIARWTANRNILYFKNLRQFQQISSPAQYDYLFSIVNHTILNQEILNLAKTAINYHDALLPAYAGVNATSWAIINGEKQHGITWHEMKLEVDTGKILKQVKIELEPSETALTLNAKCYQAAIVSFQELVEELATKKITFKSQNLQQRSYFSRHQKPPALGIIDFNASATVIDNLVRGLDFGNYPNPLATAKLVLNSTSGLDYVIVTKVTVLNTLSSQLPGTIVKIEKQRLIVATGSQDIALETIVSQQKQTQSIAELVANYQLEIGQKLPEIDAQLIAQLVKLESEIAPSQTYWVKQLSKCRQLTLPFEQIPIASAQNNCNNYRQVKLPLSSTVTNLLQDSLAVSIAAFAIYLARLSGNNRISLGFDRLTSDLHAPWFARYVPCNLSIKLEQDFTNVLKTVTNKLRLNQQHQTYSTDIMVRCPELVARQTNFSVAVTQLSRDALSPENLIVADLTLIIDRQQAEYFWSYNTQLFSAQIIETMIEQWTILLVAIALHSQCPVAELPLISTFERHKILEEWNDTKSNYPQCCLHQLFEAKVAEHSQAVAIVCQGKYLTYGELEQKANQLACYLQSLGVQAETLVGICLNRSLEMIIGLFAILKAGGAYLPLDPNYPTARLTYLLDDGGVGILLTQGKLLDRLPETSAKVVCLDQDWQEILAVNNQPISNVNSHNLAYAIYTSGSTGNPKGVEIEHHSVVNTLFDIEQRFKISSQDSVLAVSSLSFDLSVYDIFGLLGSGGRVIIPQPENCPNPEHWLKLIIQEKVTIWNSAPALMELLLDYIMTNQRTLPQSLRLILLSGDRISPHLVIQLQTLNPQLQIISLGGATEASIWSIYYPIKNLAPSTKTIPYGRPLNNQSFYILDPKLQLVPIGATGELYIGGVGVARGYLHREQLTASKFILDPFSNWATARLYKTGDLGRYLEDGNIEFLGRIDNQVKIRGVRVELGEIEATLSQYPGITETIVAIANRAKGIASDNSEQTTIVAYCVSKLKSITSKQLRDFLKTKLPEYAIPATFVFLDSVPLTPNGKINRQALLELPLNQLETENDFLPPQDTLEWQLSQIWSRILNVKPIGRDDNFFELGGNSLLALRLFEQIQTTFGKNLPLATLFQAPTIAQLASLMLEQGWSAYWSSLVSIQPHGDQSPLFLVHAVGGNVLGYRWLAEALGTDRPIYGLQARGLDGQQTPLTSIKEMAASYLEEIKLIQPQGPYFLAGHSFGGFVAFEMAQQLVQQGETVAFLALFDCFGPNDHDKSTLAQRLGIHINNLSALSLREKLAYFTDRFEYILQSKMPFAWQQRYSKLANLMRSPEQRLIAQIQNINLQAKEQYTPTVHEGKLTLFRAQARQVNGYFDPDGGWQGLALGGIDVYEVPGTHTSLLLKPENAQILAGKLKAILANFTLNLSGMS
ncbi:MAG: amino acid adenylation domain-containing protein [Hyellaceae cyanobacterium CSU_1_1]|nr:amino acid adenylation domain-containing protein [Hyellaceae cyanobacterium CSU_1_1]